MSLSKVRQLKQRHDAGIKRKQKWDTMFQLCGEYVMTRKQNFLTTNEPGEFLTEQLFSTVGPEANNTMASSLLGMMWPDGGRSIRLKRPDYIPNSKNNKEFYVRNTRVLTKAMDDPKAKLATATQEYMLDQGAFGISGIQVKRTQDYLHPLKYRALNVKHFVLEENADGEVDALFITRNLTVAQTIEEYGIENVSKKVREAFDNQCYNDKVTITWFIGPRTQAMAKFGNQAMPYASLHYENDTEKILKESGYNRIPVIIARFLKALGEIYGRSPAMFAMSAILRLNVIWELIERNGEKSENPPLYLLDSGALGGGFVDRSANGLTVFHPTGLGEQVPVGQLYDVGDPQRLFAVVESLTAEVKTAFMLDNLLDLNNEARQTLGEAQIRDRIRGEALSNVLKRQESEMFSPLAEESAATLQDMGLFGVIRGSEQERDILERGLTPYYLPSDLRDALEKNLPLYEIEFISPAKRIMKQERLNSLMMNLQLGLQYGQAFPELVDGYDPDMIRDEIIALTGYDENIIRDLETITAIRNARAQQQEQMQQVQMAQVAADVGMKSAQAQSMREGAVNGRPKG